MNYSKLLLFALGTLGGYVGRKAWSEMHDFMDEKDEQKRQQERAKEEEEEIEVPLLDCPVCGLPSEITKVIAYEIIPAIQYQYEFLLGCLGSHDPIVVSEQWILENAKIN